MDHAPPHIHVRAGENKAKIRFDNGVIVSGSIPPKTARTVRQWLNANREFAREKWREIAEAE